MFDFEKGPIKLILGGKYPHCHTVFVDDRKSALIDAASKEDALLEFLAQGPKTLEEVTQKGIIYGPPRVVAGWDLSISERSMMSKHLKRLEKQCRVTLEAGRYGLLK